VIRGVTFHYLPTREIEVHMQEKNTKTLSIIADSINVGAALIGIFGFLTGISTLPSLLSGKGSQQTNASWFLVLSRFRFHFPSSSLPWFSFTAFTLLLCSKPTDGYSYMVLSRDGNRHILFPFILKKEKYTVVGQQIYSRLFSLHRLVLQSAG
jgi:hypothetical protein